jgi:hypothetical protein
MSGYPPIFENKYAARLAALAASTVLAAHEAAAQVTVVEVNLTVTGVSDFVRINPTGTQFVQGTTAGGFSPFFDFKVTASGANITGTSQMGWIGTLTGPYGRSATNLAPGEMVETGDTFVLNGTLVGIVGAPETTFYLGYRSTAGNYGWAEFATEDGTQLDLTLVRYAFEATPGVGIEVGAIPEPAVSAGIFGVLATGFLGWRRWRRRLAA